MKRFLAMLLALVMVLSMTACSPSHETDSEESNTVTLDAGASVSEGQT